MSDGTIANPNATTNESKTCDICPPNQCERRWLVFNSNINKDGDTTVLLEQLSALGKENAAVTTSDDQQRRVALTLQITSTGGLPDQAFIVADALLKIRAHGHHVTVHILGQLSGFNYLLAAAADRVVMEPAASLTFAPMFVVASGRMDEMRAHVARERAVYERFVEAVVARAARGRSSAEAEVTEVLTAERVRGWGVRHFSPIEARALGLCDEVLDMPQHPPRNIKEEGAVDPAVASRAEEEFSCGVTDFDAFTIFGLQLRLNTWTSDPINANRGIRVRLCCRGGTVVQALSLYGQLCDAQRRGHHVTIEVAHRAYSCALWFTTCALPAGTLVLHRDAQLMFHAISVTSVAATLDTIDAELAVHAGVYAQTCGLLSTLVPGVTSAVLRGWEDKREDHYFSAQEAVALGMGNLLDTDSPAM